MAIRGAVCLVGTIVNQKLLHIYMLEMAQPREFQDLVSQVSDDIEPGRHVFKHSNMSYKIYIKTLITSLERDRSEYFITYIFGRRKYIFAPALKLLDIFIRDYDRHTRILFHKYMHPFIMNLVIQGCLYPKSLSRYIFNYSLLKAS